MDYLLDKNNKLKLKNNKQKTTCISYKDNSQMSKMIKYRIINYLCIWLANNNLLSDDVTVTYE